MFVLTCHLIKALKKPPLFEILSGNQIIRTHHENIHFVV